MTGDSHGWLLPPPWLLIALLAAQTAPPRLEAQASASQTLARHGLEAYFADSLSSGAQRVIGGDGATRRIDAGALLSRNLLLPIRVAPLPVADSVTATGDRRIVLPDRAFAQTTGGTGMLLVPVVIVEGGGLRYRDGAFRGSIRVGVEDSLQTGSAVPLPSPIRFFVSGTADSIHRPDTVVDHTNLPFPAIALVEASPGPVVSLNVRSTLHTDGVGVDIPVHLDTLALDASPRSVQGMGLEEVRLLLGPAPSGAGVAVRLVADQGNLAENVVRLSPDGTAETTLRSSWIGTSTITARGVAFAEAQTTIDFVFPWLFLAVALVGGALGGLAAWLQKKQSKAAWFRRVGSGAVLGLVAAVLYAVGVNLTPINPPVTTGQAVVFGMAALIGYLQTLTIPAAKGPS